MYCLAWEFVFPTFSCITIYQEMLLCTAKKRKFKGKYFSLIFRLFLLLFC